MLEPGIEKFILDNFLNLLDEIPYACNLLVDREGQWNFSSFEKVWENKASQSLFRGHKQRPFIERLDPNKRNSLQAFMLQVKRSLENGEDGFIGPFSNYYRKPDTSVIVIEHYISYLGKTEDGNPVFFTTTHEKAVETGQVHFPQENETTPDPSPWKLLSNRERRVARHICDGLTTKEIANTLCISERTVDSHRANIRNKLNLPRTTTIAEHLSIHPAN